MREVRTIIDNWCDMCDDRGVKTPAIRSFIMAMTAGEQRLQMMPRRIDACNEDAVVLDNLSTLLRGLPKLGGVDSETKARAVESESEVPAKTGRRLTGAPRHVNCPACTQTVGSGAFAHHCVGVHDVKRIKQPRRCPDCDASYLKQGSMVTHRRRMHGYSLTSEYLDAVRAVQQLPL